MNKINHVERPKRVIKRLILLSSILVLVIIVVSIYVILKWREKETPRGLYNTGYNYFFGKGGVPKNVVKAKYWLNKSAEQNYRPAMEMLSILMIKEAVKGNSNDKEAALMCKRVLKYDI